MRFERRRREAKEASAGALTDIMFFLMLFFLIVSTMTTPSVIKLFLPSSSNKQSVSNATTIVSINSEFQYFVDDKPVTNEELIEAIKTAIARKHSKEPVVMLRADKTVPIEYVVDVFEVGKQVKDVKIFIATQKRG
jgi:biopolymer transport protein ExbD